MPCRSEDCQGRDGLPDCRDSFCVLLLAGIQMRQRLPGVRFRLRIRRLLGELPIKGGGIGKLPLLLFKPRDCESVVLGQRSNLYGDGRYSVGAAELPIELSEAGISV